MLPRFLVVPHDEAAAAGGSIKPVDDLCLGLDSSFPWPRSSNGGFASRCCCCCCFTGANFLLFHNHTPTRSAQHVALAGAFTASTFFTPKSEFIFPPKRNQNARAFTSLLRFPPPKKNHFFQELGNCTSSSAESFQAAKRGLSLRLNPAPSPTSRVVQSTNHRGSGKTSATAPSPTREQEK